MGGALRQEQKLMNEMAQFRRPSAQGMSPAKVAPMLSSGQGVKPGLLSFLNQNYQLPQEPQPPIEPRPDSPEQNIMNLFGQIMNEAGKGGF